MNRVIFPQKLLPYLLVAPQIIITVIFFFWPASQALYDSFIRTNAFGMNPRFVGIENFIQVLHDPTYFDTVWTTVVFSLSVAVLALVSGLIFGVMAQRVIAGRGFYRTLMIWPYAVAPAVAGMLWLFMFSPQMGTFAYLLRSWGVDWNPLLNGSQAMILVVVASAWKQISYNFLFFVAGLQSIPASLIEAASIDGASRSKRFWTITFPLLAPTSFFLLVINTVYAFFDTFGIIHAVTSGGPGKSTETLVYKVFVDAFQSPSPGISAAESVILMAIVILLTSIQFRYVERKVHYA